MKTSPWILPIALAMGLTFAGCSCGGDPPTNPPGTNTDGGDADAGEVDAGPDPMSECIPLGQTCAGTGEPCCGGICNAAGLCEQVAGGCFESGTACTDSTDCCTNSCRGGFCSSDQCLDNAETCGDNSECCTSNCSGGSCAAIPGSTGTCKVLGQTCGVGTECCSTNCQGGACVPAYPGCRASSELCFQDGDCCSARCSKNDGSAGYCITNSGGCNQDGMPCAGGSNCCTRVCADPGTGATVCLPAAGCRMTGNSCSDNQACCGGGTNPNGSVTCAKAVSTDTYGRCDNGTACNPVGNICGAAFPTADGGTFSVNASQNCCDGKKEVCKRDSAGIPRCYGGGSTECPTGYTGVEPCCIPEGNVCQFKDQCCGGLPCVADTAGILRCTGSTCTPLGASCTPGTSVCCSGDCLESGEFGFFCQTPSRTDGGTTTTDAGTGDAGTVVDAGVPCKPNGQTCNTAADCCSDVCTNGTCSAPVACQPKGGTCSSTADCCSGTACLIPSGSSSGTCQDSTCAGAGQTCSSGNPCCSGMDCLKSNQSGFCDGTTACACVVRIE